MKKRLIHILNNIGKTVIIIFVLLQLYVLARLYLFASCVIPTYSMSPTLLGGDYIITSLQIPGHRICKKDNNGGIAVSRKSGIRKILRGDIVVFNFPYASRNDKMILESKLFYCKRCTGLPGERHEWEWNSKKFSIYIPRSGDELSVDAHNFNDYRRCIEYETSKYMTNIDGTILLGDSVIKTYRFKKDYYFMQGDNIYDSYDSRFWGLLPDDFILGVGKFIWFSKNMETGEIRWKRLFKML